MKLDVISIVIGRPARGASGIGILDRVFVTKTGDSAGSQQGNGLYEVQTLRINCTARLLVLEGILGSRRNSEVNDVLLAILPKDPSTTRSGAP
jgi:hypothetical protein